MIMCIFVICTEDNLPEYGTILVRYIESGVVKYKLYKNRSHDKTNETNITHWLKIEDKYEGAML
jgi:hypothetical protein